MKMSAKRKQIIAQVGLLVVLAIVAWQKLHQLPTIPSDIYPYLTSLSLATVTQSNQENQAFPSIPLEELLAIRSTLTEPEAQTLLDQLKKDVPFADLNWGVILKDKRKLVLRHREILRRYPYYQPGNYYFPILGTTWFEDTFGAAREGGKRQHEGTDLFGNEGTPIVSICAGTIEQLGWNRLGGKRVGIRGDDGNYYYYAHLQYIIRSLVKGQRVQAGETLGTMGHTGDAITTPDHLHFGMELPNGQWINPYPFLKVWQDWQVERLS